jgi:hypothetical protein
MSTDAKTRIRIEQLHERLDQAWEVFIGFCCVEHSLADNAVVDPKVQRLVTESCETAAALYAQTLLALPVENAS